MLRHVALTLFLKYDLKRGLKEIAGRTDYAPTRNAGSRAVASPIHLETQPRRPNPSHAAAATATANVTTSGPVAPRPGVRSPSLSLASSRRWRVDHSVCARFRRSSSPVFPSRRPPNLPSASADVSSHFHFHPCAPAVPPTTGNIRISKRTQQCFRFQVREFFFLTTQLLEKLSR